MKNFRITIIFLLVLIVLATIVFINKYDIVRYNGKLTIKESTGTIKALRDFAVTDTVNITKVFLADKNDNTILLERKESFWTVNENYVARPDFMQLLLETIYRVEVSEPVIKTKFDYVLKNISSTGIKVEIYIKDKLEKVYYVGGVTQNNTGTYMLLEGSDTPFICHLLGFSGFLTTRYNTDIYEWRDRLVFKSKYSDIKKVSVENTKNPNESFSCEKTKDNRFTLNDITSGKQIPYFDTLAVKKLMSRYKKVPFESYLDNTIEEYKRDSILNTEHIYKLSVEYFDGNKKSIRLFPRPNVNNQFDDDVDIYEFDIERLFGFINDDKDMVVLQYNTTDPITPELSNFLRPLL